MRSGGFLRLLEGMEEAEYQRLISLISLSRAPSLTRALYLFLGKQYLLLQNI